jgi:hypothetical protein
VLRVRVADRSRRAGVQTAFRSFDRDAMHLDIVFAPSREAALPTGLMGGRRSAQTLVVMIATSTEAGLSIRGVLAVGAVEMSRI